MGDAAEISRIAKRLIWCQTERGSPQVSLPDVHVYVAKYSVAKATSSTTIVASNSQPTK